MATFKISCSYRETSKMVAHLVIEAGSEAEALEEARQADENGDVQYFNDWSDCDDTSYRVTETISSNAAEQEAEAAMLNAYLGS